MSDVNMSYIAKLLDGVEVEYKPLGSVAELKRGKTITAKSKTDGDIPVISGGQTPAYYNAEYNREGATITIAGSGAYAGYIMFWDKPIFVSDAFSVQPDLYLLNTRYVYHFLLNNQRWIYGLQKGVGIPHVYPKDLATLVIPIPPLHVQAEIVRILDTFTELTAELTTELKLRKKQYSYYRDTLLTFAPDKAEWKTLGEVEYVKILNSKRKAVEKSLRIAGNTPYYGANNIQDYVAGKTHEGECVLIAEDGSASLENYSIQYVSGEFWANNHVHVIQGTGNLTTKFLYYYLHIVNFSSHLTGGIRAKLTKSNLMDIKIPIPPLHVQAEIVRILDNFTNLTTELTTELKLRQQQYEYYSNLLLTFPQT